MTEAEAREAWLAGFGATGEGWNQEYPFDQYGGRPEDVASREKAFMTWWNARSQAQASA